ncbi:XRE family transcriptional regulator [Rhizobium sp. 2YAF20]|uniref:XRE family transcriptional regulator n=1 Tax=Rhizobium sp. 2YAF20 TaxID=3233027 RepID=UPI003F9A20AF
MKRLMFLAETEQVRGWKLTQAEAARRLETTQPRLSDLMRGWVNSFSLDASVSLAARAGLFGADCHFRSSMIGQ